jgi:hypothetical protein
MGINGHLNITSARWSHQANKATWRLVLEWSVAGNGSDKYGCRYIFMRLALEAPSFRVARDRDGPFKNRTRLERSVLTQHLAGFMVCPKHMMRVSFTPTS